MLLDLKQILNPDHDCEKCSRLRVQRRALTADQMLWPVATIFNRSWKSTHWQAVLDLPNTCPTARGAPKANQMLGERFSTAVENRRTGSRF